MSNYDLVKNTLVEVKEKLESINQIDTSGISVHFDWSAIPVLNDHITFLISQTDGLLNSLKNEPPPIIHHLETE